MKIVSAEYWLEFTTESIGTLPKGKKLDDELQELFAAVLDKYLDSHNVSSNEVHLILSNSGVDIEDIEEEEFL